MKISKKNLISRIFALLLCLSMVFGDLSLSNLVVNADTGSSNASHQSFFTDSQGGTGWANSGNGIYRMTIINGDSIRGFAGFAGSQSSSLFGYTNYGWMELLWADDTHMVGDTAITNNSVNNSSTSAYASISGSTNTWYYWKDGGRGISDYVYSCGRSSNYVYTGGNEFKTLAELGDKYSLGIPQIVVDALSNISASSDVVQLGNELRKLDSEAYLDQKKALLSSFGITNYEDEYLIVIETLVPYGFRETGKTDFNLLITMDALTNSTSSMNISNWLKDSGKHFNASFNVGADYFYDQASKSNVQSLYHSYVEQGAIGYHGSTVSSKGLGGSAVFGELIEPTSDTEPEPPTNNPSDPPTTTTPYKGVVQNLTVEYQGDVGTNDMSKFKSASSIARGDGTTSNTYYWVKDSSQGDGEFQLFSDYKYVLGWADKIEPIESSALIYAGWTSLAVTTGNSIKTDWYLNDLIDRANKLFSLSSANITLTWKTLDNTSSEFHQRYNANKYIGGMTTISGVNSSITSLDAAQQQTILPFAIMYAVDALGTTLTNGSTTVEDAVTNDLIGGTITDYVSSAATIEEMCYRVLAKVLQGISPCANLKTNGQLAMSTTGTPNWIGLSTEFIARGSKVESNKKVIKVNLTSKESSVEETETSTYGTTGAWVTSIDNYVAGYVVVRKDQGDILDYTSIANAILASATTVTDANTVFQNSIAESLKYAKGDKTAIGTSLALGSEKVGDEYKGYTVVELIVQVDPKTEGGTLTLPSFMLNKYYKDVIYTSSTLAGKGSLYYKLLREYTYDKSKEKTAHQTVAHDDGTMHNRLCSTEDNLITDIAEKPDWTLVYKDTTEGSIAQYDTGTLLGKYYLYDDASSSYYKNEGHTSNKLTLWTEAQRSKLVGSIAWNTRQTEQENEDYAIDSSKYIYVMDYGFNFIRKPTGDERAVSGISYASYASGGSSMITNGSWSGDSSNVLQYSDKFGVVPVTGNVSSKVRTPDSEKPIVGNKINETLKISATYQITGSTSGVDYASTGTPTSNWQKSSKSLYTAAAHWFDIVMKTEYYTVTSSSYNSTTGKYDTTTETKSRQVRDDDKSKYCIGVSNYYVRTSRTSYAFRDSIYGASNTKFEYSFDGVAYKYQTTGMDTGTNSVLGGSNMKSITTAASTRPSSGNAEYRFSAVFNNGQTLKFYPEVLMKAASQGITSMSSYNTGLYQNIATMGEYKRSAESSTLYLYRFKETGGTKVTGATTTDSALGGTDATNSSKLTIPSGTDVYVSADPSGLELNMYAYALDLADSSKDGEIKGVGSYSDLVKSGANIFTAWGNSSSIHSNIKTAFETWCNNMTDINNYSADFTLKVSGSQTTKSYGAVIGKIQRGSTSATEDGVYVLVVENGALTTKGGYNQLISQIAEDYGVSSSEAEAVFKASGMHTAILNAIESSTSSVNKSGKAEINAEATDGNKNDVTSQLGNGTNWYDEKVQTFVVRRYKNEHNKFKSITATDKIDIGMGATSRNSSTKENSNNNNNKSAAWYLTLYFNNVSKVTDNLLSGNGSYLDPSTGDVGSTTYTVLANEVEVIDADFLISSSSTSNFR